MAQSGVSFSLADWTASLRLLLHAKPNPSLHSVPYKLILHFVMLLSLSVVVLCYAFQWGNYSTSMQQITCAYFYPSSCSVEDCSLFLTVNADDCYLYTTNDTALAINRAIAAYQTITGVSLAQFTYASDNCVDVGLHNAELSVHSHNSDTFSVYVDNDYDMSQTYEYLQLPHIRHIDLHFPLVNTRKSDIYSSSYAWTMHMKYSLLSEVKYRVTSAVALQGECSNRSPIDAAAVDKPLGITITLFLVILIAVAPVHSAFLCHELFDVFRSLLFVKRQLQSTTIENSTDGTAPLLCNNYTLHLRAPSELYGHNDERRAVSTWETFSLQSKLLLCDLWNVPTLLGSFLSLVFACLSIRDGVLPSKGEEVVLGVSAMLYWFGLLGFLRHNSRIFAALIILGAALAKIGKIIAGALPLAIAFMLFGMITFAESSNFFSNFQQTLYTLFSVMNGDSIWDAMNQADQALPGIGSLFVVLFYAVFNYILLRMLLACIEGMYWYFTVYAELRRKREHFRSVPNNNPSKWHRARQVSQSTDSGAGGVHPTVLPVSMFTEIIRGNDGVIIDEGDIVVDLVALGELFRQGQLGEHDESS